MFKLRFAGYINTPADLSPSHNFIKFAFSSQQNEDFVVEKCMIYVFMFFFLNINNNGFVFPFIQKDVLENFSFNLYSLKKKQRRVWSSHFLSRGGGGA